MHRSKRRILSVKEMRKPCKRHIPLRPFKQKLLLLAMGNNPQGVHDVLADHGFRLIELAERPYFKIVLDKKEKR
jgi:hypothetical protein